MRYVKYLIIRELRIVKNSLFSFFQLIAYYKSIIKL